MLPSDLNLPAKFDKWRPGQDDAAIDAACVLSSGARFYVSSQPTGAGKSAFYFAVARLLDAKRVLILTASKALQQQLSADFASIGLTDIRGQNNYACIAVAPPTGFPDGTGGLFGMAPANARCDEGPCHAGVECELRANGCLYFDQVRRALNAQFVVTNYDYWMYSNRYGEQPIGEFDLLICDEAHDAPDRLADFCSIYIGARELDDLLGQTLPPLDAGLDFWTEWAKDCHLRAKDYLEEAKLERSSVRHIRELRNLVSKLDDLSKAREWRRGNPSDPNVWVPGESSDWVAEESSTGVTFAPIWAHGYAEDFLFTHIPKVLLTSATIVPKTVSYLGLVPTDFTFNERPSSFPVARRPIYILNYARKVNATMSRGEELVWMNQIDNILATRLDRKAIIHAVSYSRAKFIFENSRFRQYMVVHDPRNIHSQVDRFRRMGATAILVSPTVREGWDFPYDQCELQIIAKIPFVDTRPAVIQARHRADKEYLNYSALMSLIQSAGRGMRAADDFCETFIIDDNIRWLIQSMSKQIPKWFRAAIRRVDTTPPATKIVKRLTASTAK